MHHFYADDTQLHVTLNHKQDFSTQLKSLGLYIDGILNINLNMLKHNYGKTEVLIVSNSSVNLIDLLIRPYLPGSQRTSLVSNIKENWV